jgi:ABC-type amino acid transport substrate-binding protein
MFLRSPRALAAPVAQPLAPRPALAPGAWPALRAGVALAGSVALVNLSVLLALAATPTSAQAGAVLDRIKAQGRIVLAHRESSVPFSYVDGGRPVGYAVDLCRRLAEAVRQKLGLATLEVAFLAVTPANRLQAIAEGRADLECGSTTNNAERRKTVAFTVPHYVTGARLLVRADSPVRELRELQGKTLVSTKGTTPLKAVEQANAQGLLGIKVVEVPDHARGVEMVEKGEAAAFAMDEVLLLGLAAGRPDPKAFVVVGKYLTIEPLAIMLAPGDAAFKKLIDDEMRRLIYSREAHAIHDRWLMRPIPPRDISLNLPLNYLTRDFWKFPTDTVPN